MTTILHDVGAEAATAPARIAYINAGLNVLRVWLPRIALMTAGIVAVIAVGVGVELRIDRPNPDAGIDGPQGREPAGDLEVTELDDASPAAEPQPAGAGPQKPPICTSAGVGLGPDLSQATEWTQGQYPLTGQTPNAVLYRLDDGSMSGVPGTVKSYAVYDAQGNILQRVDLLGRAHGGVETPHVQEYVQDTASDGTVYPRESGQARLLEPWEYPTC